MSENQCVPFTTFGPDEIGGSLPQMISCEMCGCDHEIEDSISTTTDEAGNKVTKKGTLQFFRCGGETYLVGIQGRSIVGQ